MSPDKARPYLGINFSCCGVYARIYKTARGDAYAGHCPRCLKPIRVPIGPGGTNQRIFRTKS